MSTNRAMACGYSTFAKTWSGILLMDFSRSLGNTCSRQIGYETPWGPGDIRQHDFGLEQTGSLFEKSEICPAWSRYSPGR